MMGCVDLVVWMLVLQLLGFAVLPLLLRLAPAAPDRGYALSKVCGFFIFGVVCWLVPIATGLPASSLMVSAVFALMLLIGAWSYTRPQLPFSEIKAVVRRFALPVEGVFVGLTLLFAFVRFLNPEIFWGEKPMDSSFLLFFTRNRELPPHDPWAAGSPMSYYYVGVYFVAALLKLTGIPGAIGYNLAMASLAGLIGSAVLGVLLVLTRRVWFSSIAASVLVFASNPEVVRLCFIKGKEATFDNTFWSSTRVFVSPGFLEYTGWSLLFADLHAHVIAIPFTVAALGCAALLYTSSAYRYTRGGAGLRLLLGALVGALMGLNTWDLLTFGAVIGVMTVTAPAPSFWQPPRRGDGSVALGERIFAAGFARICALVWDGVLVALGALVLIAAYQFSSPIGDRVGWGWVTTTEFNTFNKFMRVMGFQVVGLVVALLVATVAAVRERRWPRISNILFCIVGVCCICIPVALSVDRGNMRLPWITVAVCLTGVCVVGVAWWGSRVRPEQRAVALFTASAAVLVIILEIFYLMDRMNTLFKGYMAVWMLSSLAVSAGLAFIWDALRASAPKFVRGIFLFFVVGLAVVATVGGVLNVKAVVGMQRVPKRVYTLDGSAYLAATNRDEYELIRWINRVVPGAAVVLEAQGDSYREYTRIAMHTGLPTVLGWEYHTLQRGLPRQELQNRKMAIRAVYTVDEQEIDRIVDLLKTLQVDLIVASEVERATYGAENLRRFERHPEYFAPVAVFGTARLYVTTFSPLHAALLAQAELHPAQLVESNQQQ
jgi:YYY domain-containing protein